jgi:hypothetical protein
MASTAFFSWQVDTEAKVGRNFIERALKRAAARIGGDANVEEAVRDLSVDRDTKNVPGSPPIVDTIFRKIDSAAVFVPDQTFVCDRLDGRRTPNPNVLIEYGWALKSLGHGRIVPVMNTAFGKPAPEAMPFNLRHLRNPILYHCPLDAGDESRKQVREELARELERAIRVVLASDELRGSLAQPPPPPPFQAQSPADGQGRFRKTGGPLGVSDGFFDRPSAEVVLANGPVIWLRVMPTVDPGQRWLVADLMKATKTPNVMIEPFSYTEGGFYFVRGGDGFGVYTPLHADMVRAGQVVFAFCGGEIWSIDAYLLQAMASNGVKFIPDIETQLARGLPIYADFLVKLGIAPLFSWTVGMEDTMGRALYSKKWSPILARRLCMQQQIIATGSYSPGDPPRQSLRPFFAALFDACGTEWKESI